MSARHSLLGLLTALGLPVGSAQDAAAADAWLVPPNLLDPQGPVAARTAEVWWFLLITAAAVFVIVGGLLVVGLARRGREVTDGSDTADGRVVPLLVGGAVATTLVLIAVAVYTFVTMAVLAAPPEEPAHAFEVVGKQWWWEIRYRGEVIGANELHLPVGEPVRIDLRSDDVIHSFWVPDLSGKRDLIPGRTNTLWLQADAAGVYRGVCAEFCGLQHANMAFVVVAEPPARFEAWLERVRSPASAPRGEAALAGEQVFLNAGCAGCHAVRGGPARGRLGPDLTHLAGRRSLAAATLPNTVGHLGGWIVNSQAIKPGNKMPPQNLTSDDLQELLAYLQGLD